MGLKVPADLRELDDVDELLKAVQDHRPDKFDFATSKVDLIRDANGDTEDSRFVLSFFLRGILFAGKQQDPPYQPSPDMPEPYLSMTWQDVETRKDIAGWDAAFKACRFYVDYFEDRLENGDGLCLFGTTGGGKTLLACQIQKSVGGYFIPMSTLVQAYKPNGSEGVRRRVQDSDLLVIDDLGGERTTEFTMSTLDEVLYHRHNRRLSTIITSNISYDKMMAALSPRIQDRVCERMMPIELVGPSYRKAAKWFEKERGV